MTNAMDIELDTPAAGGSICPGRCNAGYRRALATYEEARQEWDAECSALPEVLAEWRAAVAEHGEDVAGPRPERPEEPEPPGWIPRPGEPVWCASCVASIRRSLADLDELASLRLTMTDGYQAPGQAITDRVSSTKSARTPSPGQDDLDDLLRWLTSWEIAYRDTQGWPHPPYRGANAPALTSAIAWMLQRVDAVLAHPDLAEDFGREVLIEHSKLQAATSTRPPLRHKPLPCPRCRRRSLFLHDDDRIHCNNEDCRRVMSKEEYEEYEEEADQQVTR
ncbi:hypothetical protein [Actinomadura decatromicini]|uniref:Uncharacterized protein n=1 Tax=Actinomadura decatromicini TaxID=2604572 RepID=A0A5D3FAS9_9ACTN|nr:hypothetical protein [Actinomadura decatromicini]TYK45182.1 hypothetical protein FXF68_31380 [Actinomadura decatromicini]